MCFCACVCVCGMRANMWDHRCKHYTIFHYTNIAVVCFIDFFIEARISLITLFIFLLKINSVGARTDFIRHAHIFHRSSTESQIAITILFMIVHKSTMLVDFLVCVYVSWDFLVSCMRYLYQFIGLIVYDAPIKRCARHITTGVHTAQQNAKYSD